MPVMIKETQATIQSVRGAIRKAEANLENIQNVTDPLAKHSASIVTKLDNSLGNLESLSSELDGFVQLATKQGGTLQKFASDPKLYENMNQSAETMTILIKNLEPIMRDVRIFSDKIARHPELIGVGGAFKGSSGIKEPSEAQQPKKVVRRPPPPLRRN